MIMDAADPAPSYLSAVVVRLATHFDRRFACWVQSVFRAELLVLSGWQECTRSRKRIPWFWLKLLVMLER